MKVQNLQIQSNYLDFILHIQLTFWNTRKYQFIRIICEACFFCCFIFVKFIFDIVVICIALSISGSELHRQVGMNMVLTSGSVGDVIVSTQAQNECMRCRYSYSCRCNISHFLPPHDTGPVTRIWYKLCIVWLLNLPCVWPLPVCM